MKRISAQDVLLEIIRKAGGQFDGKTKLYKAFYFAHLIYSQQFPGLLTTWPIVRMPQGPGIHRGDELIEDLIQKQLITSETIYENFYPEYRFRITEKGKNASDVPHEVQDVIQRATDFVIDKRASEISQLTHDRSRSWNLAKDGEILNIEIDMIPDAEYNRLRAIADTSGVMVDSIFGQDEAGKVPHEASRP